MSKHKDQKDSKEQPDSAVPEAHAPGPMPAESKPERSLPAWLWIAFAFFIVGGIGLRASQSARILASTYDAISGCEATVLAENDGLSDMYGIVQFKTNSTEVANYLTLCESDPVIALEIYRKALDEGNKNAKLVALSSSFYLSRLLEKADIDRVAGLLKPGQDNGEVRKAAQRALADLTVIKNTGDMTRFRAVPESLPAATVGAPYHSIQTIEQTWIKEPVLLVRWSNPDLAMDWWNRLGKGTLEKSDTSAANAAATQRYVISGK